MSDKILKVKPRGKWFVLEGPKGSGKTTAQNIICKASGPSVALAAEPSPLKTGVDARRLAADPTASVRAVVEAMCIDRVAHMKLVRQTLAEGRHVLQSRSYMSTGVLQGALSPPRFRVHNESHSGNPDGCVRLPRCCVVV